MGPLVQLPRTGTALGRGAALRPEALPGRQTDGVLDRRNVLSGARLLAAVGDRLAQELEQRFLFDGEPDARHRAPLSGLAKGLEWPALHVVVEEPRADVRRPADGRRV